MALETLLPESGQVVFAYIGPGAGIALAGSFLAVLVAFFAAVLAILAWPFRLLWRIVRRTRRRQNAKCNRVVVIGLDGLDAQLTEQFLEEGILPNLAEIREQGCYRRLATTYPPLSPVAWSSFATGVNPGKHNIYDFISRNPMTYGPAISSVRIFPPNRTLKLGPYRLPISRADIRGLRKSKPFWSVLGEYGVFSAVLRVPITFPCDRFNGVQLAAMSVPDLLGTQGTHSHYVETSCDARPATAASESAESLGGGSIRPLTRDQNGLSGTLHGPPNPLRGDAAELQIPFKLQKDSADHVVLRIGSQRIRLQVGENSEWIRVTFTLAPLIRLRGICRFNLRQVTPHVELYCTPIQIDPSAPAMPISHPPVYANYLSHRQGLFATMGLAEDTTAVTDGTLNEDAFLAQAGEIHEERRQMLFDSLDRVRKGLVTCVFDGPDRIQHMFWRFLDRDHPALKGHPNTHEQTIREMYQQMDQLVGEVRARIKDDTALFVMSDHGFTSFRRCVDLNRWLLENEYLVLNHDARTSDHSYLADVDWSHTRAYSVGLAGLYINQQGRESQGIVAAGREADELVGEIADKLTGLVDASLGSVAIHEAVPRGKVYSGPYVDGAPDVIVGYGIGYRVSWDSAVGKTGPAIFSDNVKPWSGDHCIHPSLVPGVLFSSEQLDAEQAGIIDMAPTVLELLGVPRPAYMDGASLIGGASLSGSQPSGPSFP